MKKLMIAAAMVCAAAMVQAGSVQWGAIGVVSSGTAYVGGTTTYSAYLFEGSDITDATSLLTGGKFKDFTDLAKQSNTATATTAATPKMNFSNKNYGSFSQGDSFTGYMVILDAAEAKDAKNYLLATWAGTGADQGKSVITKTQGASGNLMFSYGNQASNTAWTSIAPEPTSGLLLLIGMAGLALRRRRA